MSRELDRERDAIVSLCLKAADTQEQMLKMFPQNVHYKEYAQMARWVAGEVEKRRGMVFDEGGVEVESETLAALNEELRLCQAEIVEMRGLLAGLRVERGKLKNVITAHEENTARIMAIHRMSMDKHMEKDGLIKELSDKRDRAASSLDEAKEAMNVERESIRDHERGLCVETLEKMAAEMTDTHHVWAIKQAVNKLGGK